MLVVISCKEENIECTVLRGFFPNSKDPSVVLYANDTPIDTVYLDKDKNSLVFINKMLMLKIKF